MTKDRMLVICRGNPNSLNQLIVHWRKLYDLVDHDHIYDADVIWVEWANEQSERVSAMAARKNVIVRVCGSEYYQNFWTRWDRSKIYRVITVNPAYKIPGVKMTYVPDFVDMDFWKPTGSGQKDGKKRILVVGSFEYCKGQMGFLRMLVERPRYFDEVIMVGRFQVPDNPHMHITSRKLRILLMHFAQRHGINLIFKDFVPKKTLRELYNSVDFVASPSINEGCSAATQEAMSCGTPVLVNDWMGADGIFPKETMYVTSSGMWQLIDNYPDVDLRGWVRENFAAPVVIGKIDKIIRSAVRSANL